MTRTNKRIKQGNTRKIKNNNIHCTSENSPVLSLYETDSGPVESESSQTGATKSNLEPSVSTNDRYSTEY